MDLPSLIVALEASESSEEDQALNARIRALAEADREGFARALLAVESPDARSELVAALVQEGRVSPALEDLMVDLLTREVATLHASTRACTRAYDTTLLPIFGFGDLEWPAMGDALADRLSAALEPCVEHRDAYARALSADLLVAWARPGRRGAYTAVRRLLGEDPDPYVRDVAYRRLAEAGALPEGAKPPFRPTWFRGLRTLLARTNR